MRRHYGRRIIEKSTLFYSVADPKLLTSDPDPGRTFKVITYPDPNPCQVITDPYPTFQVVSDLDPFNIFLVGFSQDFFS